MVGGEVCFCHISRSKTHLQFVIRSSQSGGNCSLKSRFSIPDFVLKLLRKNRKESLEGFYGGTVTPSLYQMQRYTSHGVFVLLVMV